MTKGISSYPAHMRPMIVQRRMKRFRGDGTDGNGTLAAKAQYDRDTAKIQKATHLLSGEKIEGKGGDK